MASDPKTTPTRVRAPHGATVTEIHWADGHVGVYPNDYLRGHCPCAACQGHGGGVKFVPGGNAELREIAPVGSYALRLTWGDGHDSGIYNFEYLRSLCPCGECRPAGAS